MGRWPKATSRTAPQGWRPARAGVPRDHAFFGHPLGLFTLFGTELWERFSYYGMRAILLLLPDGHRRERRPRHRTTTSGEALVAAYGASVYLVSVLGGWLADRVIGARRSVLYGGIVIAAGHVFLSIPGAGFSFAGIVLVALGTGLLKPNVSSMVGELYARDDPRRDSAFSIFYMGINIGSLAAPFVVGAAVREAWGYHAGFARRRRRHGDRAGVLRARPPAARRRRRRPAQPAHARGPGTGPATVPPRRRGLRGRGR